MALGIKLLREPLLHFLLIGAALFFIYHLTTDRSNFNQSKDIIVISLSDIDRLSYLFEKTWKRPPNDKELKGLVDDYLEEEVLYREAMKLGLDRDDTVVRRRMRQKMEFFVNDLTEQTKPSEQQLEEFLQKNKDNYRSESALSFKHLFFKRDDSELTKNRINEITNKLNHQSIQDTSSMGDTTILPYELTGASLSEIDNHFGKGFGDKLSILDQNRWEGPIESAYGFHYIYVVEKTEGYDPKLSEVRDEVERDWKYTLQKELEQEYFRKKIDHYDVQIQWPDRAENMADQDK
jgi:hypothetical protein